MTPDDRQSFAEILLGFAELKGKALSRPAVELYWAAMQHWCIEDFRQAANHLVRTCEFMPTPKEFEDLRTAGRPTPGEAWAAAVACARRGGGGADPSIEAAVQALGGWHVIRFCNEDALHFLERRFVEHFADIADATDKRESVPQIAHAGRPRLAGRVDSESIEARLLSHLPEPTP